MTMLTKKAAIYLVLSMMGLIFAVYSIKVKNYILLVIAVLFTAVSTDNIFCNLRR